MTGPLRQSGLSLVIRAGNAGLQLVMFATLARLLGPGEFGALSAMISVGTFLSVALLFGQHTLMLRGLSAEPQGRAAGLLRIGLTVAAIGTLAGGVAVFGLGAILDRSGTANGAILMGAAVFLVPMAMAELAMTLARAHGRMALALAPRDILWRILVITAALAGLSGTFPWSGGGFAWICVLSVLLSLCVAGQLAMVARLFRGLERPGAAKQPNWWRQSLWLWLGSLAGTLAPHLGVFVIALTLSLEEAGMFFAMQRVAAVLNLPLNALNLAVAPDIARLHRQGNRAALQDLLRRNMALLAPPVLVGFLVLVIAGDRLLGLFAPAYESAHGVLLVVATGYLVRTMCGPVGVLLLMVGRERMAVLMFLLTEGATLAMLPIAGQALGLPGVAVMLALGTASVALVPAFWARRNLGVDTSALALVPRTRRGRA